jgi:hypothetical protein
MEFGTGSDASSRCESACVTRRGSTPSLGYSVTSAAAANSNPIACGLLYVSKAFEHPEQSSTLCESAAGGGACMR